MPEPTITIAQVPGSGPLYAVQDPAAKRPADRQRALAVRMAHQRARTLQAAVTYSSNVVAALAADESTNCHPDFC